MEECNTVLKIVYLWVHSSTFIIVSFGSFCMRLFFPARHRQWIRRKKSTISIFIAKYILYCGTIFFFVLSPPLYFSRFHTVPLYFILCLSFCTMFFMVFPMQLGIYEIEFFWHTIWFSTFSTFSIPSRMFILVQTQNYI